MPTSSRARRLAALLGAALLAVMPGPVGAAAPALTEVAGTGLRLAAPESGYRVAVTVLMVDGSHREAFVNITQDGATRAAEGAAEGDFVAGGPGPCADSRYDLQGFRWTKPFAWRFRASSRPESMRLARGEAQLLAAMRAITSAHNDCGRLDRVDAQSVYLGRTARKPGVRVDATLTVHCGRDGRNVVGFGALPRGVAGMTCITFTDPPHGRGRAIEADVLLDKRHVRWASSLRACSGNEVMLRSVATHEFGHVFGLGHVAESSHGNLTMSESIGPCDDSAYTLGRGDVLGLERLY